MNWNYIAGFFDGEGSAWISKDKIGIIAFPNTNKKILKEIKKFINLPSCWYKDKKKPKHKTFYRLVYSRHKDILFIAQKLVNKCIRKEKLLEVIKHSKSKKWSNELWEKLPKEILKKLYINERKSISQISKLFGYKQRSFVWLLLKRYRIKRRNLSKAQKNRYRYRKEAAK